MTRINIEEAKARLSKYMNRIAKGETFMLCRRNVPIAEIRPVKSQFRAKRR
jgi:antitoxin (DNA-binding transcriptional repressor) of toxin-antitoxin stability system